MSGYDGPSTLGNALSNVPHFTFEMHKFEVNPISVFGDYEHYLQTLGVVAAFLLVVWLLWTLIESIVRCCLWCSTKHVMMSQRQCRCRACFTAIFAIVIVAGCALLVIDSSRMSTAVQSMRGDVEDAQRYQDELLGHGNAALDCATSATDLLTVIIDSNFDEIKQEARQVKQSIGSVVSKTRSYMSKSGNYQSDIEDVLKHVKEGDSYHVWGAWVLVMLVLSVLLLLMLVNGVCCVCCPRHCKCGQGDLQQQQLQQQRFSHPSLVHSGSRHSMHDSHVSLLEGSSAASSSFSSSSSSLVPPLSASHDSMSACGYAYAGGPGGPAPPSQKRAQTCSCCRCVGDCCLHSWILLVFFVLILLASVLVGVSVGLGDVCENPNAYVQYAQLRYVGSQSTGGQLMSFYLFCDRTNPLTPPVEQALDFLRSNSTLEAIAYMQQKTQHTIYESVVDNLAANVSQATLALEQAEDMLTCWRVHNDYIDLLETGCFNLESAIFQFAVYSVTLVVFTALLRCCIPRRDRVPIEYGYLGAGAGGNGYPYSYGSMSAHGVGVGVEGLVVLEGDVPASDDLVYPYDYAAANEEGDMHHPHPHQSQYYPNAVAAPVAPAAMTHSRFAGGTGSAQGNLPGNYSQIRAFNGIHEDAPLPQYQASEAPSIFFDHGNNAFPGFMPAQSSTVSSSSSSMSADAFATGPSRASVENGRQELTRMPSNSLSAYLPVASTNPFATAAAAPMPVPTSDPQAQAQPLNAGGSYSRRGSGAASSSPSPLVPRSPHRRMVSGGSSLGDANNASINGSGAQSSHTRPSSHPSLGETGDDDDVSGLVEPGSTSEGQS